MPTHADQTSIFPDDAEPRPRPPKAKPAPGRLVQLRTGPISPADPQPGFEFDDGLSRWVQAIDWARPRTWGDCQAIGECDPCPLVMCRHHLWSASKVPGAAPGELPERTRWFEHLVDTLPPDEWGETCSLRVAQRVMIVASEEGKWLGRTRIEGEAVGRPGPSLSLVANPLWVQHEPRFQSPTEVNDAVIGRFIGCSRETARQIKARASAKLCADPALAHLADELYLPMTGLDSDSD